MLLMDRNGGMDDFRCQNLLVNYRLNGFMNYGEVNACPLS